MGGAVVSHFFKIVLEKTLRDGKMKIPPEFVRIQGGAMQEKIQLEDPTGLIWNMKLSNCDGEFWMQDGWKQFAEHYSLRHGHFLVFRHEGDNHFRVIILDMSASEMDYPLPVHLGDSESSGFQEEKVEEHDEEDVSIEILDFDPSCRKRKEISPSPSLECDPPQKIMKTGSCCRTARDSKLAQATQDLGLSRSSKRGAKLISSGCEPNSFLREKEPPESNPSRKHNGRLPIAKRGQTENPLTKQQMFLASRKADALQKARAFRSENPFFVVPMKDNHIHHDYRLSIPPSFAKFINRNSAEVILRFSEKTWRVQYTMKVYKGNKFPKFERNWKSFVQGTDLKVGDVCVFELLKGRQIIMDVTIFRVMEDQCNRCTAGEHMDYSFYSNGTGMNQPCKETNGGIRKAENGPSGDNGRIKLQNFLPEYEIQDSDDVDSSIEILYEKSSSKKGEKSPFTLPKIGKNVKKHSTEDAKRNLSFNKTAFQGFGHDQRLKAEADFVYDDERDSVLFVDTDGVIFRDLSDENDAAAVDHNENPSCLGSKQAIKDSSDIQQPSKIRDSRNFSAERPSFEAALKKYNFSSCNVYVPVQFMEMIERRDQDVILQTERGLWLVRLVRIQNLGRLCAGWTEFSRDNHLEPGDVCVFELIKTGNVELKVSIFRRPK